jgi:thiol-disulfide isomerase/thioredoxin
MTYSRFFSLITALSFFLACQSAPTEGATDANATAGTSEVGPGEAPDIRIRVNGIQSGTASLVGMLGDQQYRADTVSINRDGIFHFKKDQPYQQGMYFVLLPDEGIVQLLVTEDQTFSYTAQQGDLIGSAVVEGSLDNELLYKNLKYQEQKDPDIQQLSTRMRQLQSGTPEYEQVKTQRDALLKERQDHLDEIFSAHPNSLFTRFKKAGQNPEVREIFKPDGSLDKVAQVFQYRREFWDNVDFSDPRLLYTPVIGNKLKRYITELTPQHPDSIIYSTVKLVEKVLPYPEYFKFVVNWITLKYEPTKTTLMDPEAVFVHMIQNYFTEERAFWSNPAEVQALQLRAHEMSASLVGKKGPNVKVPGPDGQIKELYAINKPYLIVYIYNPTCEHCMVETPKLVQYYKQWKNQGIGVYAIAIDTDDAEWRQYTREKGMNDFVNVYDPTNRSIYATYFVDNTPEIYVLNPDRTIIGKNLNPDQIMIVIDRDKEKRGK